MSATVRLASDKQASPTRDPRFKLSYALLLLLLLPLLLRDFGGRFLACGSSRGMSCAQRR